MKKRLIPLFFMALTYLTFFSVTLSYGKYFGTIIVTNDLQLNIVMTPSVNPEIETPYTIFYHSYTDEGEDYIYYEQKCAANTTYTTIDGPLGPDCTWTVGGMLYFATSSSSPVHGILGETWKPGEDITFEAVKKELSYHTGNDENATEVHLFDVYNSSGDGGYSSPMLTIKLCPNSYIDHTYESRYVTYSINMQTDYQTAVLLEDTQTRWTDEDRNRSAKYNAEDGDNYFMFHPGLPYRPTVSTVAMANWSSDPYVKWGSYLNDGHMNFVTLPNEPELAYVGRVHTVDNCFTSGTLITLEDGRQIPVEDLRETDKLRVFNHETGEYTTSDILFIENDGENMYSVINLEFSNGTKTKFIYEHGLFDLDLNKYVYITEDNYREFIGHKFAVEQEIGYGYTTLVNSYLSSEFTNCYSLVTKYHMNYFVDNLFSMPGGISGLFNIFEVDEELKYDQELMQKDIEKYGLFTADEFKDYVPEAMFNEIFPMKYLKVAIGKGLITEEDIIRIIERYIFGHELDNKYN